MSNKLVTISGKHHWMTPEGRFFPVEIRDGRVVEHLYLKTPVGLFPMTESFLAPSTRFPCAKNPDRAVSREKKKQKKKSEEKLIYFDLLACPPEDSEVN